MKTIGKLLGILCLAGGVAFGGVKSVSPMEQVQAYAAAHHAKVTVQKWHGNYWVEAAGLEPFGVGKTVDEAAQEFMKAAEMMDGEANQPKLKEAPAPAKVPAGPNPLVCPDDQYCI